MAKEAPTEEMPVISYQQRMTQVGPIAHPMCSEKLHKKVLKVVKKATKQKHVKRGVKEVVKGLRKGVKGLVVIAGDISPIDVIAHLPVLCEDQDVPYIYVPSKEDLGSAGSTKRPTSCVLLEVKKDAEYADSYNEVFAQVKILNEKMIVA